MFQTWLQTHLDAFSFGTRFTKLPHKCHSLPAVLLRPQNKSFTTSIFCVQCVFELHCSVWDHSSSHDCSTHFDLITVNTHASLVSSYPSTIFVFFFMVTACWDKVVNCFPISYPQIKWNLLNILPCSFVFFSLFIQSLFSVVPQKSQPQWGGNLTVSKDTNYSESSPSVCITHLASLCTAVPSFFPVLHCFMSDNSAPDIFYPFASQLMLQLTSMFPVSPVITLVPVHAEALRIEDIVCYTLWKPMRQIFNKHV